MMLNAAEDILSLDCTAMSDDLWYFGKELIWFLSRFCNSYIGVLPLQPL